MSCIPLPPFSVCSHRSERCLLLFPLLNVLLFMFHLCFSFGPVSAPCHVIGLLPFCVHLFSVQPLIHLLHIVSKSCWALFSVPVFFWFSDASMWLFLIMDPPRLILPSCLLTYAASFDYDSWITLNKKTHTLIIHTCILSNHTLQLKYKSDGSLSGKESTIVVDFFNFHLHVLVWSV